MAKRKARESRPAEHLKTQPQTIRANGAGLPLTIPIGIPTYWSPEEALAVFELIDDIRERIWEIYHVEIQALTREHRGPAAAESAHINEDELPF